MLRCPVNIRTPNLNPLLRERTERLRTLKQTVRCHKLTAAFVTEIALFREFIARAVPRTPVEEVKLSQFDDPYWEPLLNWKGRLLGMERMLLAAGVTEAEIAEVKSDAGLPVVFRDIAPPHVA